MDKGIQDKESRPVPVERSSSVLDRRRPKDKLPLARKFLSVAVMSPLVVGSLCSAGFLAFADIEKAIVYAALGAGLTFVLCEVARLLHDDGD